jgi:hypothetical protein
VSSLSGRKLNAIEFAAGRGLTWRGKAGSLGAVEEETEESEGVVEEAAPAIDEGGPFECRVTPWYFRRMGLMILMLVGMATYFLYDGVIGYPKKNLKVDIYEAFAAGKEEGRTWESVLAELGLSGGGPEEAEHVAKVRSAFDIGKAGDVSWRAYSLEHKLPEKPERKSEHDIREQFHYAWGMYAIGGVVALVILLNARKKVRADDEAYYTTKGKRVPFQAIYRLDKRKWDNKGLAYAFYRDESDRQQKAVLDDLKFGGVGKILDRILAVFDGELVERLYLEDEEEEGEATEESPGKGVSGEAKDGD